jgi:hypothetical protein
MTRCRTVLRGRPAPRIRIFTVALAAGLATLAAAGPALACAGLVTPGGNVRLLRTATLSAWADGFEHYVTSFTFEGGGAEVGSIVPLPGVPSKVERGGDWTLQRLERETQPQPVRATAPDEAAATSDAEVVYETRIDALDITILKGGGRAVGDWAREHGFSLTPDAPEILDFYAARSPVFMAARFNTEAAQERNQEVGEGTPIHLTIPLENPWVPLRVLGLGRAPAERIDADVYLLTPDRPALLPRPGDGLVPVRSEAASDSLLDDLRSDKGMEWIPEKMWLTYLRVAEQASELRYDLAMDVRGGQPSPVMAGLEAPPPPPVPETTTTTAAPTTTTAATRPAPPTTAVKPPATSPPAPPVEAAPPVEPAPAPDPLPLLTDDPGPDVVALPSSVPARSGGPRPLVVLAAILGGGLGAGAAAAILLRRRSRSAT